MEKTVKYGAKNRELPVSMLVFHCFALPTLQMLRIFEKTNTGVHYIIQRNGKILPLVAEDKVAAHAGLSSWREFSGSVNEQSLGIELQNPLMGQQHYTKAQIKSLIELARKIIKKYDIKPENIVGHSDIAPYRKPDPAQFFPWKILAENGVGFWPEICQTDNNPHFCRDDVKQMLEKIGYDTRDLTAALYAFVMRFLPNKVQKQADIIKIEADVFAYWRGVKAEQISEKIKDAPRIYPDYAENFRYDSDVLTRLLQISEIYDK